MLKKSILKQVGLFATTCLFSINVASATERVTTGSPSEFSSNNGLLPFVSGADYVRLGGNHTLVTAAAIAIDHDIRGINLDSNSGIFQVFRNTTIGSVVNPGANGGLNVEFKGANSNITLSGLSGNVAIPANDYSGLRSVDFGNFDNKLIIQSSGVNFSNSFTSTGGDNGTINVENTGTTFSGSFDANAGSRVKEIFIKNDIGSTIFDTNLNLSGDLTVTQGSSVTFTEGRTINADHLYFGNVAQALFTTAPNMIFEDNTTVNAPIQRDEFSFSGNIEFKGGTTINGVIGSEFRRVSKVEFTSTNPNHRSSLNHDIYSGQINANNSTLGIDTGTVQFVALSNFDGTTFDLGKNSAKFTRANATFVGSPVFNTTYDGTAGGHLIAEGVAIDMSGVDAITINLTDTSSIPGPDGRKFTLFAELLNVIEQGEGGPEIRVGTITLADNENVTLNVAERPLVQWTHDNGVLCQTLVNNPEQVVINNVTDTENAEMILASPAASDLLNAVNNGAGDDVLNALQPVIALGAEAAASALETASQMVSGDVKTLTGKVSARIQQVQAIGVSSGSDSSSYGAWFAPVYGIAKQGKRSSNPGYFSRYYGGMVGVDTLIDEDTTIGFAASYMHHIIRHKHENQGDKTNMDTASLLLYGSRSLSESLFIQGVTSVGSTYVDNKEVRQTFPNPSIACAKYNARSFTAEIIGGYNHKLSKTTTITPLLGFEFTSLGKVEYDENGAGNQDLSVKRKVYNRGEVIGGIKVNKSIECSDFTFIPEAHGFVRHDLLKNKFKVDIRFKNDRSSVLIPRTAVQNRTTYLIGGGADIKKESFEYGFAYDFRFAKKYRAHQGVLTFRTEF